MYSLQIGEWKERVSKETHHIAVMLENRVLSIEYNYYVYDPAKVDAKSMRAWM